MFVHRNAAGVFFAILALTAAFQIVEVCGWGCVGHMLVAEIARRRLDKDNAAKMEAMSNNFYDSGPFPWSPDMVQAACWPDDAKQWHQYAMGSWHYIDTPYNPENITINEPVDPTNAVTVSNNMITALRNPKAPLYMLNFAWVNLAHFIGDLHQPLHAATLYSHAYPHGDRGGNAIEVKVKGKAVKLHALWDDICDVPAPYYRRPLTETDTFALAATADRLEDTYKFPSQLRQEEDPQIMADESHAFAVNSSYDGIKPGAELGETYLHRCKEVAEARITLGGYRLGYLLNKLLHNLTVSEDVTSAYRDSVQRGRRLRSRSTEKPPTQFRFREVLTVERKVYEHEHAAAEEGKVLSREERVRDVVRTRDDGEGFSLTDL